MKNALLLTIAITAAAPAWAEWTLFGTTDNGNKWYLDHSTIRVNGQIRRVWTLIDHAKPDKDGDSSARGLYEIDCQEGRSRVLQSAWYKGQMGGGDSGYSSNQPSQWSYAPPETIADSMVKVVCRRRGSSL